MTINDVYKFLYFLSNKTQSGVIRITDFNLAADRAQKELYKKEYKLFQSTQIITDAMSPFLVSKVMQVYSNGKAPYPTGYVHTTAVRVFYYKDNKAIQTDVKQANDDEIGSYLSSSIVYPTRRYPIVCYYSGYMQFYPKDLGSVNFDYLREPTTPIWDYDIVNGRPVYAPPGTTITNNPDVNGVLYPLPRLSQSNSFEFPDQQQNELVYMMCSYLGINIRENQLIGYSEEMKQQEKD